MAVTVHTNPLTGKVTCVGHTDVNLHVYADGSFDIDTGEHVMRINSSMTSAQIAACWSALFKSRENA